MIYPKNGCFNHWINIMNKKRDLGITPSFNSAPNPWDLELDSMYVLKGCRPVVKYGNVASMIYRSLSHQKNQHFYPLVI